ncbi:ABC transporter substrate-binding protein [Parafrankia discariae]|uniref:ABC transporter substrate-binding protein n=1 Tax=Parafrankia discariae TaxID=365528 RepID=UPI0004766531|nr:ABC transporter substrate-binding protein [Parafrankia discariae]
MATTRSLSWLSAVLLCAAALTGCRSDAAQSAPPCVTEGVTADEVKLGLLFPDTGLGAVTFSAARAGIDARFGAVNAAGGVHGRRIVYDWRDDTAKASMNLTTARTLVERENVFGMLETSTVASGSAAYLAERGIPVLGIAVEDAWAKYRNMFSFNYSFTAKGSVDTFGKFVHERGGTKAMILYNPLDPTVSTHIAEEFTSSFQSVGITTTTVGTDDNPVSAQADEIAQQMAAQGVDTLAGTLSTEGLARVVAAVRRQHVPLKAILSSSPAPNADLLQTYGAQLAGVTTFAAYIPLETKSPALDSYRAAMATYAPQLQDTDQTLALVGYIIADMFIRGLEETGDCPTRQGYIDALRAVKGYNAGGLIGDIDLERDFGKPAECYSFVEVNAEGSAIQIVSPNYCGHRLPD